MDTQNETRSAMTLELYLQMHAIKESSFVVPFDFLEVKIYFKGAKSHTKHQFDFKCPVAFAFLLSFKRVC